jgi:mycothiol synthase
MGWLHDVVVDREYRGRGHARAMIARVEAQLLRRGVRSLGLHVSGHNARARRLFDALGFEVISQQMVKDLPTP